MPPSKSSHGQTLSLETRLYLLHHLKLLNKSKFTAFLKTETNSDNQAYFQGYAAKSHIKDQPLMNVQVPNDVKVIVQESKIVRFYRRDFRDFHLYQGFLESQGNDNKTVKGKLSWYRKVNLLDMEHHNLPMNWDFLSRGDRTYLLEKCYKAFLAAGNKGGRTKVHQFWQENSAFNRIVVGEGVFQDISSRFQAQARSIFDKRNFSDEAQVSFLPTALQAEVLAAHPDLEALHTKIKARMAPKDLPKMTKEMAAELKIVLDELKEANIHYEMYWNYLLSLTEVPLPYETRLRSKAVDGIHRAGFLAWVHTSGRYPSYTVPTFKQDDYKVHADDDPSSRLKSSIVLPEEPSAFYTILDILERPDVRDCLIFGDAGSAGVAAEDEKMIQEMRAEFKQTGCANLNCTRAAGYNRGKNDTELFVPEIVCRLAKEIQDLLPQGHPSLVCLGCMLELAIRALFPKNSPYWLSRERWSASLVTSRDADSDFQAARSYLFRCCCIHCRHPAEIVGIASLTDPTGMLPWVCCSGKAALSKPDAPRFRGPHGSGGRCGLSGHMMFKNVYNFVVDEKKGLIRVCHQCEKHHPSKKRANGDVVTNHQIKLLLEKLENYPSAVEQGKQLALWTAQGVSISYKETCKRSGKTREVLEIINPIAKRKLVRAINVYASRQQVIGDKGESLEALRLAITQYA